VRSLHDDVVRIKEVESIPFVLVANKSDLEEYRKVSKEEGKLLADELHCLFIECSAKDNVNITECFELLVRSIREYESKFVDDNKSKRIRRCLFL